MIKFLVLTFFITLAIVAPPQESRASICEKVLAFSSQFIVWKKKPPKQSVSLENPIATTPIAKPSERYEASPQQPLVPRQMKKIRPATSPIQAVEEVPPPQLAEKAGTKENDEIFIQDLIYLDQIALLGIAKKIEPPDFHFLNRMGSSLDNEESLAFARSSVNLPILQNWYDNLLARTDKNKSVLSLLKVLGRILDYPDLLDFDLSGVAEQIENGRRGIYRLAYSVEAQSEYQGLEKNSGIIVKKAAEKALDKLQNNPSYPGLRTHRFISLNGPGGQTVFTSSVQNHTPTAYRILWYYGPDKGAITILHILPHVEPGRYGI